jgi:hypothetical protein
MYQLGWLPINDLLHLARIHGDTIPGNSVTQDFHPIQPEFTFREFGIEFVISQSLQDNTKMLRMLDFALGINENIIDEDRYELIQLIHEDRVHKVHEVGRCIGETKRHHQKFIKTVSGGESCLWNVTRSNLNLMVARSKIDLGKDFGTSQLIKEHINAEQWIFILDCHRIE